MTKRPFIIYSVSEVTEADVTLIKTLAESLDIVIVQDRDFAKAVEAIHKVRQLPDEIVSLLTDAADCIVENRFALEKAGRLAVAGTAEVLDRIANVVAASPAPKKS